MALFLLNIGYSQTVINLTTGQSLNDTLIGIVNAGGIINNTTIKLTGTFNESVTVPNGIGTTASKHLTITSDANDPTSAILNGATNDTAFTINEGYIFIKSITINGNTTNQLSTVHVNIDNTEFINDAGNISIDSCILTGISQDANSKIINLYDNYMGMGSIENISISNNIITGNAIGIGVESYYVGISNMEIKNNSVENQYSKSISVTGSMEPVKNIIILNNDIKLPIKEGDWDPACGIYLSSVSNDVNIGTGETRISGNKIYRTDIDTVKYIGIHLNYCSGTSDKFIISNNLISINNTDSSIIGIKAENPTNIQFLHNTINIQGPATTGFSYNNGGMKSGEDLIFRNNIVVSDNIVFNSIHDITYYSNYINNNCYFSQNPSTAFVNEINTIDFATWQAASSSDNNSMFTDPMLSILNDGNFNNTMLNDTATSLSEVTNDIYGTVRNSPLCDIGAKEKMFINLGNDTLLCYGEMYYLYAPTGFSYNWSTGETTQDIYVTTAGVYSVTVQETAGGALGVDTINITYRDQITSQLIESKRPTCFGYTNGLLDINANNGTAPYSYYWEGFTDTNRIENLWADTFYVNISDANNCYLDTFYVVTEPDSIKIVFNSPAFCGGCTGFITPTVTGGNSAYIYNWSNSSSDTTIFDLCTGIYSLTITDDSLCSNAASLNIAESGLAYISGTLSYAGGNIDNADARVELYKDYIDGASQLELVDQNTTSTNGFFEFTGVYPETFYLRGIVTSTNSDYDNVYTSYYANMGSTTLWPQATTLSLACEDTVENVNFLMYEIATPLTGPGVIAGHIRYQSALKSTGEPVPGAEIFTEQDPNDEPIANTVTDTLGSWTIGNLPVGTGYRIKVDIPGLPLLSTYNGITIVGGDTLNSDLNFIVDTLASDGGINIDTATAIFEVNAEIIEINTYPNPVSNYLTIETTFKNAINISYSIIDINGKEIFTSNSKIYIGQYSERIDMSNYQNGIYFMKLKLDNTYYIKKIIKK